ncbi:MAG: PTS transporter subunit IIC, partial [Turicibacter sp.]
MKTIIIIITAMLMMIIIAISQLSRKKSLKIITLTQLKVMLGTGLLLVALVFLNSYQYIMAFVLGYIYKVTPLVIASDLTMVQPVFFNDLFVILSVIVVGVIINISLAHYTKLNYIFIAPFETLLMGYVIVLFMKFSMVSISTIVMVGGLILGLIMSIGPYMISHLCEGDLYRKSTLGFFNFTGFYLSVFIGKLFGKCDVKCQEVMERKHSIILRNPIKSTLFLIIIFTIALNGLANLQGYETSMRLIILDQFSIEGDMVHLINLIGLTFAMGCLFAFYRLYIVIYPEFIAGIRQVFPSRKIATDFIYQLQECSPHIFIGFWLSVIGSFVS